MNDVRAWNTLCQGRAIYAVVAGVHNRGSAVEALVFRQVPGLTCSSSIDEVRGPRPPTAFIWIDTEYSLW